MADIRTTELLNNLKTASSLDTFLESYEWSTVPAHELLQVWLKQSGLSQSKLAEQVNISTSHCSRLISGEKKPGRDVVLKLSLALGLSLKETRHLLRLTDNGDLYSKIKRDAIIIYGINHSLGIQAVQDSLYEYGEETLHSNHHE